MKKIILAVLLSSLSLSVFAKDIINSKDVITIKVSHVVGEAAPKGQATIKFKQIMESKFPGRVKVELYHNNTLFKDQEETEALELGVVDVILPTFGKVAGVYNAKEFGIFDLPFLFSSDNEIKKYINSPTGAKLLNMLGQRDSNVEGIAYWPNAFRSYSAPIILKSPSDFAPLVFRVESDSMANYYQELGAKSTLRLGLSDLPKALKKEGEYKVDGAEQPLSNFMGSKLYESQKYITLSRHSYNGYVFISNKHWLSTLPPDIKEGFISAAKEAGDYAMQVSLSNEANLEKQIEAKGVKFYNWTPEERKQFKTVAIKVHEKFMTNVNKDFLLETYKAIK